MTVSDVTAAPCRTNPDLFHSPDLPDGEGERPTDKREREAAALALCDRCPAALFAACHRALLADPDMFVHSVAAGTTPADRGMSGVQAARRMRAFLEERKPGPKPTTPAQDKPSTLGTGGGGRTRFHPTNGAVTIRGSRLA